ncbi:glycoside hydrolase family 2 TIM barrel-domain containing protein [Fontivita pretiosa]|uniref:glycoside hydrolase family 2 TIM barrel-domain containing protein n=1 Tax=Fontivita pretiosa TaxID=2989684 RepID=UPI003D1663E5
MNSNRTRHGADGRDTNSTNVREVLRLDHGWRFHLGDVLSPLPNTHIAAYMNNKAGWARGAARGSFDDSDWRVLDLPHDWSVEGTFSPENHINQGFLPRGVGWYRRHFQLEESDRGKYIAIRFDGVATHCTVWVNGHLLHRNWCGYTPFTIDISDVAHFGPDQLNAIAVRVDATYMEGWWYEGAGIYRHVWLIKTSPVHVAEYGVFVCPEKLSNVKWRTRIETTVQNRSDSDVPIELFSRLLDPKGRQVGEAQSNLMVLARAEATVQQAIPITRPELWDIDSPSLYQVRTEVRIGGRVVDDCVTTFGYRSIRFDPKQGFFLNDRPVKLMGTCNHQDHAGVGVAVPDSINEFRIRRLREMGSNAYRCAHNPPTPQLLDACDRLGMLVMDENRNFGSSPEVLEQLRTMVRRDRNHPSVILWSICNEEAIQGTAVAARIAAAMQHEVKRLDPSRPVTAAVSGGLFNDECIASVIELIGINYQLGTYDKLHEKYPDKPLVASETHSALSTRGTYQTDPTRYVFSSYDAEKAPWGATARDTWREVSSRRFIAGLFAWTGFDYRGEPTPHGWPCVSTHWGILDTCGFEKDSFWLHKAWFTRGQLAQNRGQNQDAGGSAIGPDRGVAAFVHLLPHWNWPGHEGQAIRVAAYTNCDSVELWLNGRSLGRKPVDPIDMVQWQVPYEPGTLKAIAYLGEQRAAEQTIETTGPAVALGLEVHPSAARATLPADGELALPITVFAIDAQGRRVPTAEDRVELSIEGPGRIIGVGNGDPTCHQSDKGRERNLFRGLAQVIVQLDARPGRVRLHATSAALRSATLELPTVSAELAPAVPVAKPRYFVTNWRMSPISGDRPDVSIDAAGQDMNTWERIDPAQGPQQAWKTARGYAVYRATLTLPKIVQSSGGRIVFREVIGAAEVWLDGVKVASKPAAEPAPLETKLPPTQAPAAAVTLSVLIGPWHAPAAAGLSRAVEIVPNDEAPTTG